MMTRNEVEHRARRIWGNKKLSFLPCGDGYFVDELVPNPAYRGRDARVEGASIPQSMVRVHILDANGHTKCHDECAKKEASL